MKKDFDCIEMKRQGAARVLAEIAGMTLEEELEYWRQQTEKLKESKRKMQELSATKSGANQSPEPSSN